MQILQVKLPILSYILGTKNLQMLQRDDNGFVPILLYLYIYYYQKQDVAQKGIILSLKCKLVLWEYGFSELS